MASLNTLRTKYGIVLTVAIAIVLAAFVLDPQSLFQQTEEAADEVELTINGKEIRSKEWNEAYQTVGNQMDVEPYLVYEHFFAPELKALGVSSADETTMKRTIAQYFANNGDTADDIRNYLNTISPAQLRLQYAQIISSEAIMEGFYLNAADLEQFERMNKLSFSGRYVKYPYSDIADADFAVTDEEVKAYYDAHMLHNRHIGSRSIRYVEFAHAATTEEGAETTDMNSVVRDVEAFIKAAGNTAESFDEAVALNPSLYTQTANAPVDNGRPMSNMLLGSMDVARWVYSTTVGGINQFTVGDKTYVVMVDYVDEEEYLPFEEREQDIRTQLINDKKYEVIAQNMTIAAGKGEKFEAVKFDDITLDAHLVGAICASQQGVETKVKGDDAAYIFVVDDIQGELGDVASQRISHTDKQEILNQNHAMSSFLSNLEVENPHRN